MKKKNLIFFLFLFGILTSYSQNITIKGKITDTNGNSLPGANIAVKGTNDQSSAVGDGSFAIKAQNGATLVISYIGYEDKEVKVTGTTMNIVLSEGAQNLKEVVVVTSLGIGRKKGALGYAVQEVKGTDIVETKRENFLNALQGRVAGLTVTSTSGAPGASATIQLRGVNSISGNNSPLFIVDGLPVSNSTLSQGLLLSNGPNRDADYTNRGADINPDDIESITILKGPEAAALYGIEAGNGAIVITTKKGRKGEGSLTFSTDLRTDQVYRFPETQQVYRRGIVGLDNNNYRRHFGTPYAPETQLYNNVDNFFVTGVKKTNTLAFEAGGDVMTYRLSLANTSQEGVIPNTAYDKLNITLSGTAKINDKLKSQASIAYTKAKNVKATKGAGGFLLNLLAYPADEDVTNYLNPDGTKRRITDGSLDTEVDNPFFDINKNKAEDKNYRLVSNVSLTYDPLSWLSFTGRFGADANSTQGFKSIHPESARNAGVGVSAVSGISSGGYFESYNDQTNNISFLGYATAKQSIGKFNGMLRIGAAHNNNHYEILSTKGEKYYERDFMSINNTDPLTQRSQTRIIRKQISGAFGEFSLDYNKIVYLTLTGRNDYSSTLPKKNMDFFYPSASLSFVFSELIKENSILSYGKLRASHAKVANDAKAHTITPSYEIKTTTGGGFGYGFSAGSPELEAEMNVSTEFGAELRFFNDRFGIDVAVYRRTTENSIISDLRLSYGTGYVLSNYNLGELQNEGLEITLTGTPVKTNNFSWNIMANFTKTDSELIKLNGTPEFYMSDTNIAGSVKSVFRPGFPLTAIAGATNLTNNNGDILINPTNGQTIGTGATLAVIADTNPDFMIGFQNSFAYKDFKLSFLLDIRKGGDIYNATERYLWTQGLSMRSLDREQPLIVSGVLRDGLENSDTPTQNNIQVTPYYQNDYYNTNVIDSDFIEKDINWLRMRDITLSYRLPSDLMEKSNLFKSIAFNLTVTDAFMITNYTGADPAVNGLNASAGGAGGTGYDYGALSTPRGINLGVKFGL